MQDKKQQGWGSPGAARKAHYFISSRSLCMKWFYQGSLIDSDATTPNDCAECKKRLQVLRSSEPK